MKPTQMGWVKQQLIERGEVSRNDALKNHITRLGAIIYSLTHDEGWEIDGRWRKSLFGKDYVYYKRNRPIKTAEEANNFLRSI